MNIELHGFLPEHAKDIAIAVWSKLSREEFPDSAVTVVSDQSYDHNYRNAPFFRVFSDKKKDFELIAGLIRPLRMPGAGMKTFVECVLLSDCIELDANEPKKTEADYSPLSGNFGP